MISFNFKTKKNGVPIISKADIEYMAEKVVNSYNPKLMEGPEALDVELFIESYAGLEMDYQDLTHDGSILGMTVFNDCRIPVYDSQSDKAVRIDVNEGTIIIDNSLLERDQLRRGRFTLAHEAAHWLLHRDIYLVNQDQISIFDVLGSNDSKLPVIKCRKYDIESKEKKDFVSDDDWIEWQADYMASALLMPRMPFKRVVEEHFKLANTSTCFCQSGRVLASDTWAVALISELANYFEVSATAARIRLKNLGFIKDIIDYQQKFFL